MSSEPKFSQTSQIVFVLDNVSNWRSLLGNVPASAEIHVLDSGADALAQMASLLAGRSGIAALHLVSHGNAGSLALGTTTLTSDTLLSNQPHLATIGAALTGNADLMLYGCEVAAGTTGARFIQALATATGADVAASTNRTGSSSLGGDAVLEAATGAIEAIALDLSGYAGVLANPSISDLAPAVSYAKGDPATLIDSSLTVSASTGFTDGYLRFSLASSLASDQFSLSSSATPDASGAISVVGSDVYLGNGSSRVRIGSVDSVENGLNGRPLKINFSTAFPNGNFEESASNWSIVKGVYGDNAGEINLDNYAIPLATNSDRDSTYSGGTGRTNVQTGTITYGNTGVVSGVGVAGSKALFLASTGNIVRSDQDSQNGFKPDGYGTFLGPYATSSVMTVENGDSMSLEFKAVGSGDDYEVFGLLRRVDGSGNFISDSLNGGDNIVFFAERGADTGGYKTVTKTGLTAGNYKFEFIGGTYDGSGGLAVGSSLYVDNIRLTSATGVNADVLKAIAQQVQYINTSDAPPEAGRTLTLTARDSDSNVSAPVTTVLTITAVNHAPVAQNIAATGLEDATVIVLTPVSSDANGSDTAAYTVNSGPANGQVSFNAVSGHFDYVPVANFNGTDSFTYRVTDSAGATSVATATVTVTAVNDAPVAQSAAANVTEGAGVITGVLIATDVDSPTLTFALNAGAPAGVSLNADGSYSFDPANAAYDGLAAGQTRTLTVGYSVTDGSLSDSNNLLISITGTNDAPHFSGASMLRAVEEDTANPPGDTVASLFGRLFQDADQADALSGIVIAADASSTQQGVWQYSLNGTSWSDIGTVSAGTGLVLAPSAWLRFLPVASGEETSAYQGTPGSLSVHAIDMTYTGSFTTGSNRATFDTTAIGSTGSTSAVSAAATLLGTAVVHLATPAGLNLTGTPGNDNYQGNAGNDTLTGQDGDDSLYGGAGNDTIPGGAGNDTLIGAMGDDILNGGDGNDSLRGGGGNDSLDGGAGDDTLDGGSGNDVMIGGDGNDTYVVDNAGDVVSEVGGSGIDTVLSTVTYSLNTAAAAGVENLTLTGTGGINATGNALANTLTGNAGDNVLDGGAGADVMIGGAGNDTYVVDNAGDVVTEVGGSGIDTVLSSVTYSLNTAAAADVENLTLTGTGGINATGNALANTLTGNAGDNVLDGGAGNDTLIGGAGNDTLIGGAGDDYIDGGSGNDTMIGGEGNDTFVVDSPNDVVIAGAGYDTVQYALGNGLFVHSAYTFTMADDLENLILAGTKKLSGIGNALTNFITGNAADNTLDGKAGADTLTGGAGDDLYVVDDIGDLVIENTGEGTDRVESTISYTLGANVENLTLTGTGTINATGNALANTLMGNAGDNVLDGGAGTDTLIGGAGNDTYVADNALDVIIESITGGIDQVLVNFAPAGNSYTLGRFLENATLLAAGIYGLKGNELDNTLTGNGSNNVLDGGAGNDTLDGGAGADIMIGGVGNDTYLVDNTGDVMSEVGGSGIDTVRSSVTYSINTAAAAGVENLTLTGMVAINATGNALANTLTGNGAANVLDGGAGNDTLDGGAGADTLIGGDGNDTYVVDDVGDVMSEVGGSGMDTVLSSVTYSLNTAAAAGVENLTLTGTGGINATGNALANTLTGNAGDNVLDGGSGNDTLIGGAGNDTYVVDNAGDVVSEIGGSGIDTVLSSVTYSLNTAAATGVENLTLTGSGGINATGNALANTLTGNAGDNVLDSGAGADVMIGGAGNDTYVVDNAGDVVTEVGGSGIDTVLSSVTYSLNTAAAAGVENLSLTGSGGINATGNALANTLTGNGSNNVLDGGAGSDTLRGGAGADVLTGGAGSDTFVFGLGDSGQVSGFDRITDYAKGLVGTGDMIDFSGALTIGGSALNASSTQASINQTTGIASFAALSGTTLADALADIATRFTAAGDSVDEFACFKVLAAGDYYLFISDGIAGVGANDVVVQLMGVSTIVGVDLSGGNLTVLA